MINAFNALVIPANNKLIELLQGSNGDVIPVTVKYPSGTTQIIEDGMVTECDHAGAYEQTKSELHLIGDYSSGNYEMNWKDSEVLTCDRCDAQLGDDGEWYESGEWHE